MTASSPDQEHERKEWRAHDYSLSFSPERPHLALHSDKSRPMLAYGCAHFLDLCSKETLMRTLGHLEVPFQRSASKVVLAKALLGVADVSDEERQSMLVRLAEIEEKAAKKAAALAAKADGGQDEPEEGGDEVEERAGGAPAQPPKILAKIAAMEVAYLQGNETAARALTEEETDEGVEAMASAARKAKAAEGNPPAYVTKQGLAASSGDGAPVDPEPAPEEVTAEKAAKLVAQYSPAASALAAPPGCRLRQYADARGRSYWKADAPHFPDFHPLKLSHVPTPPCPPAALPNCLRPATCPSALPNCLRPPFQHLPCPVLYSNRRPPCRRAASTAATSPAAPALVRGCAMRRLHAEFAPRGCRTLRPPVPATSDWPKACQSEKARGEVR